jgi:hypothetical protein
MAKESAPAQVAVRSRPTQAPDPAPGGPPVLWWKAWLLIVLAVCVTGAVPVAAAGNLLGVWLVSVPGAPQFAVTPTATVPPDLALPRQAWIATGASVSAQPGGGTPVASLEPGFPVTLVAHALSGGVTWSRILWSGPTPATGGSGWVRDNALISYGAGGRPIGDLGALSPSLAQAITSYGDAFSAAVYFPEAGQLYRVRADQSFALGDGFRAVLLAALYAHAESQHTAAPSAAAGSPSTKVAGGDAPSAAVAYTQVGGAQDVSSYLTGLGLAGVQPGPNDWNGAQATATGMLAFYAALDGGQALNKTDTGAVKTLLAGGDSASVTTILDGGTAGKSGLLIAGSAQAGGEWTVSACGIVVPATGPRYLVATAIRNQPSQSGALLALATFFAHLSPLLTTAG